MRDRKLQHSLFECLCVCLIFTPYAALAQQTPSAPQAAAAAPAPSPRTAHANSAQQKDADDLEPAVNTSAETASSQAGREPGAKPKPASRASGKAMDHLELGTTDITGNRELPKVMYIVPWKRSDLGDLTGKPLNSLVDQTLEPVDRNVFERSNRYYGAMTNGAAQDAHRTPDAGSRSTVRDEK